VEEYQGSGDDKTVSSTPPTLKGFLSLFLVVHLTGKDHGKKKKNKKNTSVRKHSLNLGNISGRASGEPLDWK
jgi:hypothetical protein